MAKTKRNCYWLVKKIFNNLKSFLLWPISHINDVRCYIDNRWISKSHALTSNLKRGQWHDLDTRLLHAIFDELVNFVEIEQAWMFIICSEDEYKKYKIPWYRSILHVGSWRCPEAGIAYLEWAAGLKNDSNWIDKNDPRFGQSTIQALAAQETLVLYQWWKKERPKRLDPGETSGWNEYCDENYKTAKIHDNDTVLGNIVTNQMEDEYSRNILDIYRKLEKEQEEEDTAMLIRLIKIRQSFWT